MPELQKRRQLVNSKIEMLNREQELLRKMAADKKKETDIKASLQEFAALVSSSLNRISFENKQKLLRMVLDKVVVNDWKVDVYYNIPLPRPTPTPEQKVSTKFDLRSTCPDMRNPNLRLAFSVTLSSSPNRYPLYARRPKQSWLKERKKKTEV